MFECKIKKKQPNNCIFCYYKPCIFEILGKKFCSLDIFLYLCKPIEHQEWHKAHQPASEISLASVVRKMRVKKFNSLTKCKRYGDQND